MVFCGQKITLSRLTLANFVFVHSLFFVTFIVSFAAHNTCLIIVCACAFRDRRVRPRDSAIKVHRRSVYIYSLSV